MVRRRRVSKVEHFHKRVAGLLGRCDRRVNLAQAHNADRRGLYVQCQAPISVRFYFRVLYVFACRRLRNEGTASTVSPITYDGRRDVRVLVFQGVDSAPVSFLHRSTARSANVLPVRLAVSVSRLRRDQGGQLLVILNGRAERSTLEEFQRCSVSRAVRASLLHWARANCRTSSRRLVRN